MKLTVGNSVYEMKAEQLKAVLHVASKQVPLGIYAVSKKRHGYSFERDLFHPRGAEKGCF